MGQVIEIEDHRPEVLHRDQYLALERARRAREAREYRRMLLQHWMLIGVVIALMSGCCWALFQIARGATW